MADIFLAGPSFTELHIDGQEQCKLIANSGQRAGGGEEDSLQISSSSQGGWSITAESWLGSRGSLYIGRVGPDGFNYSDLRISQDDNCPYFSLGMRLNQTALVRFQRNMSVHFGRYPGRNMRETNAFEQPCLTWPQKVDSNTFLNVTTSQVRHQLEQNRIYLYARPNLTDDPFKSHGYLESANGHPFFTFSNACILWTENELIVTICENQKIDQRSLCYAPRGYLCIPYDARRSIAIYNELGWFVGTVQVVNENDQDFACFTNGELSWKE